MIQRIPIQIGALFRCAIRYDPRSTHSEWERHECHHNQIRFVSISKLMSKKITEPTFEKYTQKCDKHLALHYYHIVQFSYKYSIALTGWLQQQWFIYLFIKGSRCCMVGKYGFVWPQIPLFGFYKFKTVSKQTVE